MKEERRMREAQEMTGGFEGKEREETDAKGRKEERRKRNER